jgi:hypothetical protein
MARDGEARPGAKGVVNVYDVTCPDCGAKPGESCINLKTAADLETPHRRREVEAQGS